VEHVGVVAQRHASSGADLGRVDVLVEIHDVLALGMHLHQARERVCV